MDAQTPKYQDQKGKESKQLRSFCVETLVQGPHHVPSIFIHYITPLLFPLAFQGLSTKDTQHSLRFN
ncbi:hypothetical protein L1887_20824 [Cichorium endivia]|nr:hypothetical protein L1887_20824 [Cichorium endivia]